MTISQVSTWSNEAWTTTYGAVDPGVPDPDYSNRTKSVTASATGSGSGSRSSPWTLQQAMENARPGDIVGIEAGIYTGTEPSGWNWNNYDGNRHYPAFYPRNSGTASDPIVFVAQYPAATTEGPWSEIRSGGQVDPNYPAAGTPRRGWPCFGSPYTNKTDYIHLVGVYMNEGNPDSHIAEDCGLINIWGGSYSNKSINWKISKCRLFGDPQARSAKHSRGGGNNYTAIRLELADGVEVSDCHFEKWYPYRSQVNNTSIETYSSNKLHFHHNYITKAGYGWYQKGTNTTNYASEDSIFEYNRVHDCWAGWRIMAPFMYPLNDKYASELTYYRHNICTEVSHVFDYAATASHNVGTLSRVYNNTFTSSKNHGSENDAIWMESVYHERSPVDNDFYNNICTGFRHTCLNYGLTTAFVVYYWPRDYNLWGYSGGITQRSSPSRSEWMSTYERDINSKWNEDPQFVGGGDYRLKSGSPAENAGRGGVNMGAYITGNEAIGIRSGTTGSEGSVVFGEDFEAQTIGTDGFTMAPPAIAAPGSDWWYFGGDAGATSGVYNGPDSKTLHHNYVATPGGLGTDSYGRCETGFKNAPITNASLGFDMYIPDGTESWGGAAFKFRDNNGASNAKVFRWKTGFGDHAVGASFWRIDDNTGFIQLDLASNDYMEPGGPTYTVITAASRGKWIKLRFDIIGCTSTNPNTNIRVFVDNVLRIEHTYNQYNGGAIGYKEGYIMGTWNTGFDEATTFPVDNFELKAI